MSPADVLGFAWGALRGHRLRCGLSLLGVAIGVAAVILLTGLGEGARLYVTGEFASLGANLVAVIPGRTETTGAAPILGGVPNDLTLDDVAAITRAVPLVRSIAPLAFGTALARVGERSREVPVAGTTASWAEVRGLTLRSGRFLPAGDPRKADRVCVIGATVERELFRDGSPLGAVIRVGGERFRVIGVTAPTGVSIGLDQDEMIHIPVAAALRLFNRRGLFRILATVRSHQDLARAQQRIREVLTERHGEEDVTVITEDSVLSSFSRILVVLTAALAGIAAVSLSVAGIGIMNVMLVSVTERTREIGLLKALGVTPRQILLVFLVEAALLSSAGGVLGLAGGLAAGRAVVALYPSFPLQAPAWAIFGALAVSSTVGIVFGVWPARRAAALEPVAALWRR